MKKIRWIVSVLLILSFLNLNGCTVGQDNDQNTFQGYREDID